MKCYRKLMSKREKAHIKKEKEEEQAAGRKGKHVHPPFFFSD